MSKRKATCVELLHPKTQQNISETGLVNFLLNPSLGDKGVPIPISTVIFGIVLLIATLYFFAYEPLKSMLYSNKLESVYITVTVAVISSATAFIVGLIWAKVNPKEKKTSRSLEDVLERLENRYGNKDKILQEIEGQITQEIAYVTASNQIITKEWFISPKTRHIVKLSEIVAIVGSMDRGTHIMTDEGEIISSMFGADTWGATFELFKSANPYLLSNNDAVAMPNGKDEAVYTVFSVKNARFIIDEFSRRKQG